MKALAALFTAVAATATLAEPTPPDAPKSKPLTVKTPDGVTIAAQEWGNPNGLEILFIHGFPFDHTMWRSQTASLAGWRRRPTPGCATWSTPSSARSTNPSDKTKWTSRS